MSTATAFVFNKNYRDVEQIAHLMPAYEARRAELDAAGQYAYNDSFKGRIGAEGPSEDTAVYLCQRLHELRKLDERIAAFLASGGRVPANEKPGSILRGTVVVYGYYMGGTGWTEYESARLCIERDGKPYAVIPKGKQRGLRLTGKVLFREGAK